MINVSKRLQMFLIAIVLLIFNSVSWSAIITLDSSNNYAAELETGVTLSRGTVSNGTGPLLISGGEFAIGTSDVAIFPGQNRIGGSSANLAALGGQKPAELAQNGTSFTIRADETGNLYDAVLIYFSGNQRSTGIPPSPLNDATTVYEITPSVVPLPAAGYLFLSALIWLRARA
ncbi:MAG: hypothetical protein AAF387_21255 [Pseudomonadota bacterium]